MGFLEEGPRDARTERIVVDADDSTLVDMIHAEPDGAAELGVVLSPDIHGLRPLFDEVCRRLATHGFAVLAPEPFARVPARKRKKLEPGDRVALMHELDDATQVGDLTGAADFIAGAHALDRVSILGFCMGGMYTLKAAATGAFARAVPFYGMIRLPEKWRGPGQREPLETAADVCPTLAIFGDADTFTPPADIEALRAAWKRRTDCEIVVYPGAEHGFIHDPERPSHQPDAAKAAWTRALAFLRA